jgi:hypothetical protein
VRENVMLRDCGLRGIDPADGRNIEVVATGIPVLHGIPLAIDATIISPLHADGTPHPHADTRPGSSLLRAEKSKADTYPELVSGSQLRLLTVACEVGGRTNQNVWFILEALAESKVRSIPEARRRHVARWWQSRWMSMLAVATQVAVSSTLLDEGTALLDGCDGPTPSGHEAEEERAPPWPASVSVVSGPELRLAE